MNEVSISIFYEDRENGEVGSVEKYASLCTPSFPASLLT
jgi:hypothetical protein